MGWRRVAWHPVGADIPGGSPRGARGLCRSIRLLESSTTVPIVVKGSLSPLFSGRDFGPTARSLWTFVQIWRRSNRTNAQLFPSFVSTFGGQWPVLERFRTAEDVTQFRRSKRIYPRGDRKLCGMEDPAEANANPAGVVAFVRRAGGIGVGDTDGSPLSERCRPGSTADRPVGGHVM